MTESMGHLNFEEQGKMIAKIGNRILYVNDKPVEDGFDTYKAKGDATIQQIPDKNTERSGLYITAPSGSGKSFYTREYIAQYHKMYPSVEKIHLIVVLFQVLLQLYCLHMFHY